MKKHILRTAARRNFRRLIGLTILAAVLAASLSVNVFAKYTYQISDGGSVTTHRTHSSDPEQVLQEAGYVLSFDDKFTTAVQNGVRHIAINRAMTVTVNYYGTVRTVTTPGETVARLLKRLGIHLREQDHMSCAPNSPVEDGMVITISEIMAEVIEYEDAVPAEIRVEESDELSGDDIRVVSEGADGLSRFVAEVTYENGLEISRQILFEQTLTEPVPWVLACSPGSTDQVWERLNAEPDGVSALIAKEPAEPEPAEPQHTDPTPAEPESTGGTVPPTEPEATRPQPTEAPTEPEPADELPDGLPVSYSRVLTCTATGYSCEGYTGYTATGTVARVGAIAVDPTVIPLGSRLYIVSDDGYCVYGYCTAEDTGGLVKGNHVDLYFDTVAECYAFGRRNVTVYVLD